MGWIAGKVYRQKITIQEGNVFADHTDFPVAIEISGANNVFTKAQADGYDIIFSNDAEEILSYERSVWDIGNELAVFYVKTDLSSTKATNLYMYYGGATIVVDPQNATAVWDNNFVGVWHLEETPNSISQDSTSNNNDLTHYNMFADDLIDGVIGKGYNFDGSNDRLQKSSFSNWPTSAITAELIMASSDTSKNCTTFSYAINSTYNNEFLIFNHTRSAVIYSHNANWNSGQSFNDGNWHYSAATWQSSGGTTRIFKDGVQAGGSGSINSGGSMGSNGTLVIAQEQDTVGGGFDSSQAYLGNLDEIRISNIVRPDEWIRTTYENLVNNSSFFTLGGEEDTPYLIEDIPTAITIFDDANSLLGTRNYLTEFTISVASTVYYDMPTDVSLADMVQTTSGINNIDVELGFAASGILADAERDTDVDFYISNSGILGTDAKNIFTNFTVGDQPVAITDPYGGVDIRSELTVGYLLTPSGYGENVDVTLGIGTPFDSERDLDIDFSIATSVMFNYETEVFASTISGTAVATPWYDGSWSYRQKITIDYTRVVANHTDFPVAIRIFGSNEVFTKSLGSGNDILFTDSLHNKLSHELSRFEVGNEELLAYVKTDLSSSANIVLYMYYGNNFALDQSDMDNAWASHYRGVYHFEESSGSLLDSSGNNRDSDVESGVIRDQPGLLGGYSWAFDSSDYVQINQAKGLVITGNTARTVTSYMYPTTNEGGQNAWSSLIVIGDGAGGLRSWMLSVDNAGECSPSQSIGIHYWGTNTCTGKTLTNIGINQWHQYAGTHNGSNAQRVFLNGNFEGSTSYTLNTVNTNAYIGRRVAQTSYAFRGRIGEIRVSDSNLGDAWIETEYNNMLDNANFFSLDSEEEYAAPYWILASRFETDVTVSGGLSYPINVDVFSSVSGTQYNMEADLWISLANTTPSGLPQDPLISGSYYGAEATVSGGLSHPLETDVYVSLLDVVDGVTIDGPITTGNYLSADMRLFALQIDNFFLDVDEYVTSTATMYVDITDKRGIPIDTANSYFIIDGVPVTSGIWFTPVSRPTASGYRMYYDPPGDFVADDSTEVIVHAQNVINDWLEQTYYLLWGYNLIVNATELHSWGWDKEVIVWSTASNLARCPAGSADAWHIRTAPKPFKDLSASIVPQVKYKDLSAVIYPISTAIYYDGTYKITVNLKDSAGNEMPPFSLEFTVEDKPN